MEWMAIPYIPHADHSSYVHTCIYIYIYICTFTYTYQHLHTYVHIYIYIYMYQLDFYVISVSLSLSISPSLSLCLFIHPPIHPPIHPSIYIHTYILTYIHTYTDIHTYIHTYIHMVGTVSIRIFQDFTIRLIHEDWLQMLSFCSGIAGTMWASSSLVIQYVTLWTFLPVSMFRSHSPSKETVHLPSTLQLIESHGIPQ